ncbi:D-alanyl-D-alanine carboxypeptidase [Kitasatospora cheerisanensis KCTC 2395]|uniref:D-alanyl-D-alanine carboxypeptidase n=1 Tax=Kitasatospora cheerisanensis KCTC 2395 TaxID=1348663 RepID=A0A066YU68_9ACTN|nr:serine hydrolase [Kitasatospora cheerisanensis]KDN85093.1 D-alanyl-D-alanine carboxypeptidase [Kitasatospora cheerisanensis KCTC 2395]
MQIIRRIVHGSSAAALVLLATGPVTANAATGDAPPPVVVGGDRLGAAGVQVAPGPGAPPLPGSLTGKSWVVADATTGEVLASFNAHAQLPPASTLKMLFADTVLPRFPADEVHRVTWAELQGMGAGSSLVGIKEDLDYKVEDLWRGVFLSSGNDAVHVLAHMNGGVAKTVAEMQARAEQLQARDTHVVTPDGYDMDGQVTSAYDLTLFARAGLRMPEFRGYCATRSAQFPGAVDKKTGQRGSFGIANTDRLLGKYPGLIGVKNGYTTNAGATYTGAAERDGHTLLVTVMHPTSSPTVYDEAASLLDWGFAAVGKVTSVGVLADDQAPPAETTAAPARPVTDAPSAPPPPNRRPPARAAAPGAGRRPAGRRPGGARGGRRAGRGDLVGGRPVRGGRGRGHAATARPAPPGPPQRPPPRPPARPAPPPQEPGAAALGPVFKPASQARGVRCVLSACRVEGLVLDVLGLSPGAARVRAGRRGAGGGLKTGPSPSARGPRGGRCGPRGWRRGAAGRGGRGG